jgi:DNA replication protein
MTTFKGFPSGKAQTVAIHSQFISELVPQIENLAELKLCLFCYYALLQKEGHYRYLRRDDLLSSKELMQGLGDEAVLDTALAEAVEHGFLLAAEVSLEWGRERLYFVNTAKGRSAVEQIEAGRWKPSEIEAVEILPERPSIFRLYEENIGALTPMIAERLKAAEDDFSYEWIVEAIDLAIDNNKRKWAYINAILERWKQEGRANVHETTERPHQSDGKFATSRWSDFSE